ncbi:MAG: recombinase family protein [Rickettsiales bacterium]|nr:recombinase family protein [Rickettsiales bacterium]
MTENLTTKPKIRCAIYTRKSNEDGLEQEFNSIDAQRLSGENFIASQVGKGWVLVDEHYDDGGYSGGTLERPALKRLFRDIEENKIDCVVIYKIDRLSRSLFDFQKIIELFDQKKVSFASVTQNFTTDDSVGRLMLNVMLSFAQYERELTGERIRDKVDASKKKGMWMGGNPSLGYDINDRKLVINEAEAKIVRILFQNFIENQSVTETARELNKSGFTTKTWISASGKLQQGQKFNKKNVRRILENPIYAGKIKHKNQLYDGQHKAIIADDIWQKTKEILSKNQSNKPSIPVSRITVAPLLKGLINCGVCGSKMIPTYTIKKGKRYRYYLCSSKAVGNNDSCAVGRISATEAENLVTNQVLNLLKKPEFIVNTISQSAGKIQESVVINSFKQIEKVWDELFPIEQARIISLLVKDITINPNGINIRIFKEGLHSLSTELTA